MDGITVVLAAVAGALAVVALVLLVLWRRARRAATRNEFDRTAAERERLDLELTLAEQTTRLRVVRELHELAVHSVSVIISNADGARYAAAQDPGVAARSAAVIADTARHTLADLRRVMALSREGEAAAGPQPRLSSVRDLFKVMRDAGLDVEFREVGERIDLKQGAELAVYRILQEALANALAHGGEGTSAIVTFTWNDAGLEVVVADDGARAAARREGLDPDEVATRPGFAAFIDKIGFDTPKTVVYCTNPEEYGYTRATGYNSYTGLSDEANDRLHALGYGAMVLGQDWGHEDNIDVVHPSAMGGVKMAAEIATQVQDLAGRLGYLEGS